MPGTQVEVKADVRVGIDALRRYGIEAFTKAGLPEEGTAYGFASEESLCRWAAGTMHAERFARALGTMKIGQQLEGTDTASRALKRIEAEAERVRGELEELGKETGLATGSPEFLSETATQSPLLRTLEVYRLEGGRWTLLETYEDEAKVQAEPFDAVELDLGAIWAR